MPKAIKYPFLYSVYLIMVWTVYRFSGITIPEVLDEFVVKPIVWIGPIIFIIRSEKDWLKSLGVTRQNLLPGLYLAAILGVTFAIEAYVVNYLKYGNSFAFNLTKTPIFYALFVSLGTAVSEELAFRGFIFNRYSKYFKNEILAILLTSLLWVVIHIPASFALLGYSFYDAFSFWFLAFLYSVGACFIFARTKNIFSAIVLYVLWESVIILFR